MATRLNKRQVDSVRDTIKCSQLINFLQDYALDGEYRGKKVDASRIRAAQAALNFALPQLKAMEITGADGKAMAVNVVRYTDNPK